MRLGAGPAARVRGDPRTAVPTGPCPGGWGRAARAGLPEAFESDDFIVAFARAGDTPESLAARYLGDAAKAWMIEDYAGTRALSAGQEVVIPRRAWNLSGVRADGYQIVPILCYHNLGRAGQGAAGHGGVDLPRADAVSQGQRLPRDQPARVRGVHAARAPASASGRWCSPSTTGTSRSSEYAYPVLKELGFPATLFVYTDYVGAGRNALSWQDLRELAAEGFDVQAHSKTHGDLRRIAGEPDAQYQRRMQAELAQPQELFQKNLGRRADDHRVPLRELG